MLFWLLLFLFSVYVVLAVVVVAAAGATAASAGPVVHSLQVLPFSSPRCFLDEAKAMLS